MPFKESLISKGQMLNSQSLNVYCTLTCLDCNEPLSRVLEGKAKESVHLVIITNRPLESNPVASELDSREARQ